MNRTPASPAPAVSVAIDETAPTPAILFGLGGDANVPMNLDEAVATASRVLALVMEARRIGGAAA